jgi:hypothetical protein
MLIGLFTLAAVIGASYKNDLAAVYVAVGIGAVIYLLHAIEFKLNKLLDHYGISAPNYEISRD